MVEKHLNNEVWLFICVVSAPSGFRGAVGFVDVLLALSFILSLSFLDTKKRLPVIRKSLIAVGGYSVFLGGLSL